HADRLAVSELADQDHVRILAKGRAHAVREAADMRAELALNDLRALALVHELDRVLEADDVQGPMRVDVIDHRRERRRLAGAGRRPGAYHAPVRIAEPREDGRKTQSLQPRDLRRDAAERRAGPGRPPTQVHAEPSAVLRDGREVESVAGAEALALTFG